VGVGGRGGLGQGVGRWAASRAAAAADRHRVHRALAEVTDPATDPDRRAWHRARATTGPDEEVAAELEQSAGRAQARGGAAAAAAFLKRSVALTSDPRRRAQRCLAAAQTHLQAGAFDDALRLVASAEGGALGELGRGRVGLLGGQVEFAPSRGGDAPALLLNAAKRIEPLDVALARETYLDAWGAAFFAGRFARDGALGEVSRAAISAPEPTSASRPSELLLDGLAVLVTEGRAAAAPKLRQAARVFAAAELDTADGLRWGWRATAAALMLWDDESRYKLAVRQLQMVREAGLLVHLPIYLQAAGVNVALRGDFATAASLNAEADTIAEATGARIARFTAVILAGMQG